MTTTTTTTTMMNDDEDEFDDNDMPSPLKRTIESSVSSTFDYFLAHAASAVGIMSFLAR